MSLTPQTTPEELKRTAGELMRRSLTLPTDEARALLEPFAIELCRWQQARVAPYGAFAAGAEPERFEDIPAVPTPLFAEVPFCSSESPQVRFQTSGTTTGRRGTHLMPDSHLADLSAKLWFDASLPDRPEACLALVPNPRESSDSSLGHMVGVLFPEATWGFSTRSGVDHNACRDLLSSQREPIFIAATALALADLLESIDPTPLPRGSVVMVTGGYKGQRREIPEELLLERCRELLGEPRVVREYGMTELSSQLWDCGEGYKAPPWLVVYTVDPATGAPCEGEGLLRFVDLANWGSALAIETRDLGVVEGGVVTLNGRLAGARIRGCSLSAEEAL